MVLIRIATRSRRTLRKTPRQPVLLPQQLNGAASQDGIRSSETEAILMALQAPASPEQQAAATSVPATAAASEMEKSGDAVSTGKRKQPDDFKENPDNSQGRQHSFWRPVPLKVTDQTVASRIATRLLDSGGQQQRDSSSKPKTDAASHYCECGKCRPPSDFLGPEARRAPSGARSAPSKPNDAVDVRSKRCECGGHAPTFGLPGSQRQKGRPVVLPVPLQARQCRGCRHQAMRVREARTKLRAPWYQRQEERDMVLPVPLQAHLCGERGDQAL